MYGGAADSGEESAEGVVVVELAEFAGDAHHFLEHEGAVLGFVAQQDEICDPGCEVVEVLLHAFDVNEVFASGAVGGFEFEVSYEVAGPDGGEHDPVHAG
jgi:hypothetical protein